MRLEQGNMVDAQTDLDTALRLKPDLSDALLLRAALRRAQGEAFGAIGDLQHALDTAPPDWPLREQATIAGRDQSEDNSAPQTWSLKLAGQYPGLPGYVLVVC